MIDHTVVWPELGFQMTLTEDEESEGYQRTIEYYSQDDEGADRPAHADEFEEKINTNATFRRFVIALGLLQSLVKVTTVGVAAIGSLFMVGSSAYVGGSSSAVFWVLLVAAIAIVFLDRMVDKVWKSPLSLVSIYSVAILASIVLLGYYLAKYRGGSLSTIYKYATARGSNRLLLEEMVRVGRRIHI